jgi:hypothetical protein
MGLWVGRPRLLQDERIQWRIACNWKQDARACGGFLWMTDTALVFEPNRLDSLTGGKSRRVALSEIDEVTEEPGGNPSFSGGLRPRIRLSLKNGQQELLLVNKIQSRLRAIREAVELAR